MSEMEEKKAAEAAHVEAEGISLLEQAISATKQARLAHIGMLNKRV